MVHKMKLFSQSFMMGTKPPIEQDGGVTYIMQPPLIGGPSNASRLWFKMVVELWISRANYIGFHQKNLHDNDTNTP